MGATGHTSNKDFRRNVDIRKKMKQGVKKTNIVLPDEDFVYGMPNPPHEDIADLIYNTYGNKAEESIKQEYENYIAQKSKVYRRPKVIPRFINPKVEEMKKKEEERKANSLDAPIEEENLEEEKKEPEKPLYKLKMFLNVGSKVAEGIKKFKTYKPYKIKEHHEEESDAINKIISDVQEDVKQKEQIEQPSN
jgi:thiamine kinase-like enzyme